MAENDKKNDDIIIVDDYNDDGFDGYEESYEDDEFDGYEEPVELYELDEYSEVDEWNELDEIDGYDDVDELALLDDYELAAGTYYTTNNSEPEKRSSKNKFLAAGLAAAILVACAVLIVLTGNKTLGNIKTLLQKEEEEKITLLDIGNELDAIELIGGDKFEEIFAAQTIRSQEAKKKAIEEAFSFDEKESEKNLVNVSVKLSSMLKDLKIKAVNDNNKLIANVPFSVEVKGPDGNVQTFTDDNKDGIIYLEGLKGGKYSVKTLGLSGYEDKFLFADKTDYIDVKETLEYKKVDVSNEIKSEKDINVGVEDPGAKKPVQPKQDDPIEKPDDPNVTGNDPADTPKEKTFGIDVSKWNGNIDWASVAADGVSYAIIRCGFRGSTEGGLIEDSMFYQNIKGATNNGIKVGIYFFSQAVNEVEAVEEASMVLDMIRGYNISYPIFLDVETSGGGRGDRIGVSERTAVCKAFCETIRNSGYTAGVYSNKTWFEEKMNVGELTGYKLWLAQYAKEVTYTKTRYDIWQYSDSGSVLGISTGVDLNMSYLGY